MQPDAKFSSQKLHQISDVGNMKLITKPFAEITDPLRFFVTLGFFDFFGGGKMAPACYLEMTKAGLLVSLLLVAELLVLQLGGSNHILIWKFPTR